MEIEEELKTFKLYLQSRGYRLSSVYKMVNGLKLYLEWLILENLDPIDIKHNDLIAYINYCKENGNVVRTLNHKLKSIQRYYNLLQSENIIEYNPCLDLRVKGAIKRKPHDLLEYEDLQELYKAFPSHGLEHKRAKTILGLLIFQGLKTEEISRLQVQDIKLEEGIVSVSPGARTNGRDLILSSAQILQLQAYIIQIRPALLKQYDKVSNDLVITNERENSLGNTMKYLVQLMKKVNPRVKGVKQIRASVITYWLSKDHIRQVQYKAGHRYVSSTEHYQINKLESLQEQIDKFHPLK